MVIPVVNSGANHPKVALKNLRATGKHFTELKNPRKTFSLSNWELKTESQKYMLQKLSSAELPRVLCGQVSFHEDTELGNIFARKAGKCLRALTWGVNPFFWAQETRNQPHKQFLLRLTKSDTMDAQLVFK